MNVVVDAVEAYVFGLVFAVAVVAALWAVARVGLRFTEWAGSAVSRLNGRRRHNPATCPWCRAGR